jgi:hypothetical protein
MNTSGSDWLMMTVVVIAHQLNVLLMHMDPEIQSQKNLLTGLNKSAYFPWFATVPATQLHRTKYQLGVLVWYVQRCLVKDAKTLM